jgi:hypothetical protein
MDPISVVARKGERASSQRSAVSNQPKTVHSGTGVSPVAVHGGVGVSPAAVKNVRYPEKPERIVSPLGRNPPSPGLRRTSPLDGLVMEDNVAAGFTPASTGASKDHLPQDDVAASRAASAALGFRDDAHGILPRILLLRRSRRLGFGAGCIRATPKAGAAIRAIREMFLRMFVPVSRSTAWRNSCASNSRSLPPSQPRHNHQPSANLAAP